MSYLSRTLCCALLLCLATRSVRSEDTPQADRFAKWEPEIQKFEALDHAKLPAPGGIVFVGSSSIRLWDLAKSFPDFPVINRGFGGSHMVDSAHFASRIVLPYHPKIVVVYAGDNDIKDKKTPEQVLADFKTFATTIHESLPTTRIVYLPIKPSPSRWSLVDAQRKANELVAQYAASTKYISVVDVATPLLGENGEPDRSLFKDDMLHLEENGYKRWTAVLAPVLKDLMAPKVFTDRPLSDSRIKPLRVYGDSYHPWTPPTTKEAWEKEAEKIRRQAIVACGLWPMPEKTELNPVIHGKVDRDDFTVERVFFASRPGLYVTGSLYRPKNVTGKVPGVLCPHGHWKNGRFYDAGDKDAAAQIKMEAETLDSAAHYPLQARMVHLARMGCTVFHYDMIGTADQKPLGHAAGFNDAEASFYLQNHLGMQTWNSIRALDFVLSLPEVDSQRIGVTGASGGGTQTFMLCAVDPRPTVAFPAVMVSTNMQGGCPCENADYLRIGINNIALAALTAPRPLGMVGADDWTIDIETKGLPELQQIYGLYGQKDFVSAKTYRQFPHNYNQKSRELMYQWFAKHLGLPADVPLKERDFKPLTQEDLTVFTSDHPLPEDALPEAKLRDLMTTASQSAIAKAAAGTPQDRDAFRGVVRSALEVMVDERLPTSEELTLVPAPPRDLDNNQVLLSGAVIRKPTQETIPGIAIRSQNAFSGTIVLWFDEGGKSCLFDGSGKSTAAVQKLTDQGHVVASVDLFLTGESRDAALAKQPENQKGKPLYAVDAKFPGYTFGYNRPGLSQQVRDILATISAARSRGEVQKLILVGRGPAALPTVIAAAMAGDQVDATYVDLMGFSFDKVQTVEDRQMLPGAKKYGGVGAFLSLIEHPISVYGVAEEDQSLAEKLSNSAEHLKFQKAHPTAQEFAELITP